MPEVNPSNVHDILARHMLVDGYPLVLDLERCTPFTIYDSREGREYLDFFTYFASSPFGNNHPKLVEPEFQAKLGRVASNKPSNSDLYTTEMAELVDKFPERFVAAVACLPTNDVDAAQREAQRSIETLSMKEVQIEYTWPYQGNPGSCGLLLFATRQLNSS